MQRRRRSSLAGSPLLIGAVTTLIVVVAVFLSYNANNGLPFVPTYNVNVELGQANGLQKSNQVKIAGTRVGTISNIKAVQNPRTGEVRAIAELKLEKKVEPLPANTRAVVLSVSAVGLKYLELEKGNSIRKLHGGGTIPISQTREPVNIEDLFNMFDKPTRTTIKINTTNFGDGVAARGLGLNRTIFEFKPLVTNAIPVLHNLASPKTDLHGFFAGLDRAASQTAPVAQQNANYYTDLDIFFKAWASVAPSIEAATRGGPPSLEQAIHSLPTQGVFAENAAEFMHLLRPSAAILRTLAQPLGHAFQVGAVNLRAATQLNSALANSSKALAEFGENPIVTLSFEDFTHTLEVGNPLLAGITPAQSVCNYFTLAFRNVASLQSETVGVGTIARAQVVLAPTGENNEGFPSSSFANGPSHEFEAGSGRLFDAHNNHLHVNPYPNVSGPGQPPKLCEAGNETYIPGQPQLGNLPAAFVSKNREITSRNTNLFGETYPESTLKALGLVKGKGK
jgi:ABC-type transporter Mla subunit MlaD